MDQVDKVREFFKYISIGAIIRSCISNLFVVMYFALEFYDIIPLGVFICQPCIILSTDKGFGFNTSQILEIIIYVNLINSMIYSLVAGAIWVGRRNPAYAWLAPVTYFAIPLLFLVGVWARLWG